MLAMLGQQKPQSWSAKFILKFPNVYKLKQSKQIQILQNYFTIHVAGLTAGENK